MAGGSERRGVATGWWDVTVAARCCTGGDPKKFESVVGPFAAKGSGVITAADRCDNAEAEEDSRDETAAAPLLSVALVAACCWWACCAAVEVIDGGATKGTAAVVLEKVGNG